MLLLRSGEIVWRVRWRDARGRNRSRVLSRKRDAEAFDAELRRRKRTGDLAALDAGRETLDEYVADTWSRAHAAHLASRTRQTYSSTYDRHISPGLGGVQLREIDAEAIASFQGDLIRSGFGPHAIRKAMTLLGGILQRAAESKRIDFNPQRVVRKARLPRSPEVRPLAPAQIEELRSRIPRNRPPRNFLQTTNAPTRIRTWGLLLRRESLYPAELSGPTRRLRLSEAVSGRGVSSALPARVHTGRVAIIMYTPQGD
jgi:hypothetical protein